MNQTDNCLSCQVANGIIVPPGGFIYESETWTINHQLPPSSIIGWLILQPRRHVDALHALSLQEQYEMASLLSYLDRFLRISRNTQKVYVCLFAESDFCPHIHFHIIPRTADLHVVGPAIFGYIPDKYPSDEEIVRFVYSAKKQFQQLIQSDIEERS